LRGHRGYTSPARPVTQAPNHSPPAFAVGATTSFSEFRYVMQRVEADTAVWAEISRTTLSRKEATQLLGTLRTLHMVHQYKAPRHDQKPSEPQPGRGPPMEVQSARHEQEGEASDPDCAVPSLTALHVLPDRLAHAAQVPLDALPCGAGVHRLAFDARGLSVLAPLRAVSFCLFKSASFAPLVHCGLTRARR